MGKGRQLLMHAEHVCICRHDQPALTEVESAVSSDAKTSLSWYSLCSFWRATDLLGDLAAATTLNPCCRYCFTCSRPRPREAPVTTHVSCCGAILCVT